MLSRDQAVDAVLVVTVRCGELPTTQIASRTDEDAEALRAWLASPEVIAGLLDIVESLDPALAAGAGAVHAARAALAGRNAAAAGPSPEVSR